MKVLLFTSRNKNVFPGTLNEYSKTPDDCETKSETIRMENWGYAYAQRKMKVFSMKVNNRQSRSACTMGHSFGFDEDKVWVNHGCRADFDVEMTVCD